MSGPDRSRRRTAAEEEELAALEAAASSDPLAPSTPMEREIVRAEADGDAAGAAALRDMAGPVEVPVSVDPSLPPPVSLRRMMSEPMAVDPSTAPLSVAMGRAPVTPGDAPMSVDPGPAAPAPAPMSRPSFAFAPGGSGVTLDLSGASPEDRLMRAFGEAGSLPVGTPPAASISLPPTAGAPAPRRARSAGMGSSASSASPAPVDPEAEANNALLADLMSETPMSTLPARLYDNRPEDSLSRDQRLAAEASRLETRRAEVAGMAAADERDRLAGEQSARTELEDQRRLAMGQARERYRNAVDRAASMTLDPDGYYNDRALGGRLGAAIAIGLGAIGAAATGGENVALQMINDEIDRDLMAQQQNIESAFRRADYEGGILDLMSGEFEDRGAALEAARAVALEDAAQRVAEEESRLAAGEARLNAEALRAQLMEQAQAAAAAAQAAEEERLMTQALQLQQLRIRTARADREERRAASAGGGAVEYAEPTDARLNAANRLIDTGVDPVEAARSVGIDPALVRGGRFAEASNTDAAGNIAALSAALDEIEGLVPSAESGEDVPGVGMTGIVPGPMLSDEGRNLRAALTNADDLLGRLRSGGAITEGEREAFHAILTGAGTDQALREGIRRIRREIEARTVRVREGRTMDESERDALSGLGGRVVED